jgi:hypothetical protein
MTELTPPADGGGHITLMAAGELRDAIAAHHRGDTPAAVYIQDRRYRTEEGTDGKPQKVKTDRYGTGIRCRARYVAPDGTEKNRSFLANTSAPTNTGSHRSRST